MTNHTAKRDRGTDAIIEHNTSGSRTQVAAGRSGSSATSDIDSRVSDAMEVTVALEDAVRGVSADMDTTTDAMVAGDSGSKHNGGRSAVSLGVTVVVLEVFVGASTGTEVGKNVTGDQTAGASSTVSGINSMTSFVEIVSVLEVIGGNSGSGRGSAVSSMTSDVVVANVAVLDVA
ncbi:hypothetical protein PHYSODRAFT_254492 [Phytophthora sojae]|uniref:Uncharacterized protein n=1 Tax=Phytophthora sojae (strain P6497) TaxID=1094619 RepID=G5AE72_PHYSP|nr:hypothetical protein PHYSODRAFT_254492 [Phytophthora sojae]EGZ06474.1 hypothetical protein PHYSODRAFT_254492 [Phytophthora sojae]|eukprot:XP_009538371.1 hypothetical protein PHYSODRAFT_254492 [Phytophthora sojae]